MIVFHKHKRINTSFGSCGMRIARVYEIFQNKVLDIHIIKNKNIKSFGYDILS
jgi:hypothetical protein